MTITLDPRQWEQVLALLQQVSAPYAITAPLIQAIHEQVTAEQSRPDNVVPMESA